MMSPSLYSYEDENVQNLIKKEEIESRQKFKYRSKYADKVRHDYKVAKQGHQTMGYAEVPLNPPNQYLKKHTRPLLKVIVDHHCLGRHSPRRTFPGVLESPENQREKENKEFHRPKRNFIKANAELIGKIHPIQRKPKVQDSAKGHTDVCLLPYYVWSKNFGRTPEYIIKRKHEYERYLEEQHNRDADDEPSHPFQQIPQQEKLEILQGLKNFWSETQREFQALPLKIDTEPLKKRKTMLENKLKSLEKDIDLMERHDTIYVMPNREGY